MKLAAIDIGSNAIRLQIVEVYEEGDKVSFKTIQFLRFPLRLGKDVFRKGRIESKTIEKFCKLMQTFRLLIELYDIKDYAAVATSAMREAKNGEEVKEQIFERVGLKIDIIPGKKEAKILNKAILPYLKNGHYMHIDVGGGSTELNLFKDKVLIDSKSFKIGSVRKLELEDRMKAFQGMSDWVKSTGLHKVSNIIGIGTGGNINKLFKLAKHTNGLFISLAELKALRAYLKAFTFRERMSIIKLNSDRADVIIPASEIYLKSMQAVKSNHIMVPKVGLKDGLVYDLYESVTKRDLTKIEFLF